MPSPGKVAQALAEKLAAIAILTEAFLREAAD
jgi:hypothetical protein